MDTNHTYHTLDAHWPMPDCMMPDGGEACAAFHSLIKHNQRLQERIAALQTDNDAGKELMRQAWFQFNATRARDGAPPGVAHGYWSKLTDALQDLLGDDAQPWMTGAAKKLIATWEWDKNE